MINCVRPVRVSAESTGVHIRLVHDAPMLAVKQQEANLLLGRKQGLDEQNKRFQINVCQCSQFLATARHEEENGEGAGAGVRTQLGVQVVQLLARDASFDCDFKLRPPLADDYVRAAAHDTGATLLLSEGTCAPAQQVGHPLVAVLIQFLDDVVVGVQ